jgi:hypothetical protein
MKTSLVLALLAFSLPALATDVINQDRKAYKLTILDGSYTSTKTISAGGSIYGLCGSGPCTFSIKGSKLAGVGKNDRIIISGGVIKRQ